MADEVYDGAIGIDLGKKLCMQNFYPESQILKSGSA